jgi:hypothetical protein
MAALVACGLAAWLHEKPWLAAAFFALAALVKLPALAVPAALFPAVLASPRERRSWRAYVALAAPFVAAAAWGGYHDSVTGFWFFGPGAPTAPRSFDVPGVLFPYFYVRQLRVLLLVAGALAFSWVRGVRREHFGNDAFTCACAAAAPFLFHCVVVVFLPRYALAAMPAFVALTLTMVRRAVRGTAFGAFAAAIFVLFASRWHPHRARADAYELQPPDDLTYLDHIAIAREAAAFVDTRYPEAEILGGYHETLTLAEPENGYVTRPHDVTHCQYFVRHETRVQIAFLHRFGLEQRICDDVVRKHETERLAFFESNGRWIELRLLVGVGP